MDGERKAIPFLTFTLSEESYALPITEVREVLEVIKITRIPKTPDYVCGVINLRGGVVTVVDLRLKFGMEAAEKTVNTSIIIIEMDLQGETVLLGALVDSVKEVLELEGSQISPPPKLGMNLKADFILGIGRKGDEFLLILDTTKIFTTSDLIAVKELKAAMANGAEK